MCKGLTFLESNNELVLLVEVHSVQEINTFKAPNTLFPVVVLTRPTSSNALNGLRSPRVSSTLQSLPVAYSLHGNKKISTKEKRCMHCYNSIIILTLRHIYRFISYILLIKSKFLQDPTSKQKPSAIGWKHNHVQSNIIIYI